MSGNTIVAWGGLLVGIAFGAAARLSGFCLLSGLRGWWISGDGRMIRCFALAVSVALVGTQLLQFAGAVDLSQSVYVRQSFSPLLVFFGGTLFGVGMVMANGCGARAVVLLAGGNLRSFVVLLCIGIAGYIALTGLLAPLRASAARLLAVEAPAEAATIPGMLAHFGMAPVAAAGLSVAVVAAILVCFAFLHRPFRRSPRLIAGGLAVGLIITAGWAVTGLAADEFDPVQPASVSFIAPVGDALLYAMQSTGIGLKFGVTVVAGTLLGAFLVAAMQGTLKLEGFASPQIMARYMAGGALMGIGGALASGCSIGQGLSGVSTLALMSIPAIAGILAGTAIGLRQLAQPAALAST